MAKGKKQLGPSFISCSHEPSTAYLKGTLPWSLELCLCTGLSPALSCKLWQFWFLSLISSAQRVSWYRLPAEFWSFSQSQEPVQMEAPLRHFPSLWDHISSFPAHWYLKVIGSSILSFCCPCCFWHLSRANLIYFAPFSSSSFLNGHACGLWKFPGQGLYPSLSCDLQGRQGIQLCGARDRTRASTVTRTTAVNSQPTVPQQERPIFFFPKENAVSLIFKLFLSAWLKEGFCCCKLVKSTTRFFMSFILSFIASWNLIH